MRASLLLVLSCLFALVTLGDEKKSATKTDAERIIELEQTDSKVMEHLDTLVNRIGPRLSGSNNLQTASEWAREKFESLGLSNSRLEKWGEFPVGFNRGPWYGRVVEPEARNLTFITASWTAGTKGVVRGNAVLQPTNEEELEQAKGKLAGAWVMTQTPRPPSKIRAQLEELYQEEGVAGVVIRNRGELLITRGSYRNATWDKLPSRPEVLLIQSDWDAIAELMKQDQEVTLEFDIRNHFKKGPIPLYNVIADIPGTEWPNEYVIVGGHLDSWDGATGTCDNGTGCSTTIEAARLLSKIAAKPRRTIRFMLWTGEEQGILGSFAYVRNNTEEMGNISAVLVHDGGTNYVSGINATKTMVDDFKSVFQPLIGLSDEMPFEINEVKGLRGGGSDHTPFLRAGVPAFFWRQAGRASYRRVHHTQYDTYDAAIPEYQQHTSTVVAVAALGIANLDHKLSRENLVAPSLFTRNRADRTVGVELKELAVTSVLKGSIAEKKELKTGDLFVAVDGAAVKDLAELRRAIQRGEPKKKVKLKRGEETIEIELDLSGQPRRFAGTRRIMGVQLDGTKILQVLPNTLAAKRELKEGDVVLKVDGKAVDSQESLIEAVQAGMPTKKLLVKRGDKELEVEFDWTAPQSGI